MNARQVSRLGVGEDGSQASGSAVLLVHAMFRINNDAPDFRDPDRRQLGSASQLVPRWSLSIWPVSSARISPRSRLHGLLFIGGKNLERRRPPRFRIAVLSQAMRLHHRPLGVRQNESIHPKLESRTKAGENPEPQQTLVAAHNARPSRASGFVVCPACSTAWG